MTIPNIPVVGGEGIPVIQVNGTGVKLIQTIRPSNIGVSYISDARIWTIQPPKSLPITCLLYTSPSPRDRTRSRMPSSA